MIARRQPVLRDQMPVEIDEGERGIHRRDVQHLAAVFRIGLDPAIGDGERLSVGQQDRLVRADAARREFADARVGIGRVVDADDALRRRQNRSRSRRAAFRPPNRRRGRRNGGPAARRKPAARARPRMSKATAKVPGRRAKATARPLSPVHREIMAARRQRDLADEIAALAEDHDGEAAVRAASPARGSAPRSSRAPRPDAARGRRRAPRPRRRAASGGRRSSPQSPSSELKPGVRPAQTATCRWKRSRRLCSTIAA